MKRTRLLVLAALWGGPAFAHGGETGGDAPGWTWDAWVTGPLALSLGLFLLGFARLYARAGAGRPALRRRAWLFASGWLILTLALVSPLHQAGERAFAAHMLEHELLMLAAAPLLVLSRPVAVMLWAFPTAIRQGLAGLGHQGWFSAAWRRLCDPVVATLLQAAALWLWHAPALFDLALASPAWHAAQHLSFLVSALLFWTAMLEGRAQARGAGIAVVCLFATSVVSGALGALMAFSRSPWYAPYEALGLAPFGLTPAEDQQLAGLLMWVPGGLVHAVAALLVLSRLLRSDPAPEAGHAG